MLHLRRNRRSLYKAVWKNYRQKNYRQTDTCCQSVLLSRSHRTVAASRSPLILCGCSHDSETTKYSKYSVRSKRYVWPYCTTTRCISTSVGTSAHATAHTISSRLAADRLIRDMTEEERDHLSRALRHLKQEFQLEDTSHVDDKPTMRQLWLTAFNNSVPFIGFGFLDNAIMIIAGEYIDCTVGAAFGISTMAAAAIGNMISDIFGIGLAGYVEVLASRLGVEEAHLTAHQLLMKSTRLATYSGRAVGIAIGCLIGMFPLLFHTSKPDPHCEHEDRVEEKSC